MSIRIASLLALIVAALAAEPEAHAQSTDGFHAIQVFPIVVHSASFTQRFHFRTTQDGSAFVSATYYPARGTGQPTPLACPAFEIPWGGRTFDSLRAICPGLASGSQFGLLLLEQGSLENRPFSGFSRVSNPAGAGFAVEAFPAHTFTSAFATASGLRRSAATVLAPAFQTNCFVGLLAERNLPPSQLATTRVLMGLFDKAGDQLGDAITHDLLPGEMVRVLDVFAAVDSPPGDHEDASFVARRVETIPFRRDLPGVVSFCTVQDNTSFGADFRIAKQEYGLDGVIPLGAGAQDGHVSRDTRAFADAPALYGQPARAFSISRAQPRQNTHAVYFRHPDLVACELIDPGTNLRMQPARGLELRLLGLDAEGWIVLAGGDNVTGWSRTYLGDKRQRLHGSNGRHLVQVESNELVPAGPEEVSYGLHCTSGSGHTAGDTIWHHLPRDDF